MSAHEGGGNGRISVSVDALRAELAEFKLQLLTELRVEMDRKASRAFVENLDERVKTLEARDAAEVAVSIHSEDTFSKREKIMGLVFAGLLFLVAVVGMIFQAWPQ